jgi:hypothetical protein
MPYNGGGVGMYNPAYPTAHQGGPPVHMMPPPVVSLHHHHQHPHHSPHHPQFTAQGFASQQQQHVPNVVSPGPLPAGGKPVVQASPSSSSSGSAPGAAAGQPKDRQKEKEERKKEKSKIPVNTAVGGGSAGKDKLTGPIDSEKKFRKVVGSYIVKHLKKYLDQVRTYYDTIFSHCFSISAVVIVIIFYFLFTVAHALTIDAQGKVKSKDDFKHLARKLTHLVVEKEQRRLLVKKVSKKGRNGT